MKKTAQVLFLGVIATISLQAEIKGAMILGERTNIKVEKNLVDPQYRYSEIMRNASNYLPMPDTYLADVPKPKLGMSEWGFGVTGHWIMTHNNESVSCNSERMELDHAWMTAVGGEPTRTEPVVYIAGRGWYIHKKVLKNNIHFSGKLNQHIKSCVKNLNSRIVLPFVVVNGVKIDDHARKAGASSANSSRMR